MEINLKLDAPVIGELAAALRFAAEQLAALVSAQAAPGIPTGAPVQLSESAQTCKTGVPARGQGLPLQAPTATVPTRGQIPTAPVPVPVQVPTDAQRQGLVPVTVGAPEATLGAQLVPTVAPSYKIEEIMRAASVVADKGMRPQVLQLMQTFGIQQLALLPPDRFGEFAAQLRGMGAQI
ncbi:MAG: hypothetical protein RSC06_04750 [Clostridia bacterium]